MPEKPQALLSRWQAGDEDAARQLFDLYVDRLLILARQRISQRLGCRVDAEDVVQSVFRTFFDRAKAGRFVLTDEEDLCKVLARITVHKTFRQIAFHMAAKRDFRMEMGHGEESHQHLLALLDGGPTPETTNQFLDQLDHFLKSLKTDERKILEMRMQGYKDVEIANALRISDRKIRRVMERVRGLAEQEGFSKNGCMPGDQE
jgi:RNA polymerase sigma-70 factor (ECF subfamily)